MTDNKKAKLLRLTLVLAALAQIDSRPVVGKGAYASLVSVLVGNVTTTQGESK